MRICVINQVTRILNVLCLIGFNKLTEAYSVFKAELENAADPATRLNASLLYELNCTDSEVAAPRSVVWLICDMMVC